MDDNDEAEKEKFEQKLKEVEKVCKPAITRMYDGAE